jgi:RES domain
MFLQFTGRAGDGTRGCERVPVRPSRIWLKPVAQEFNVSAILEHSLETSRSFGDDWIAAQTSLALRVPSVVAPHSWNYLLNPAHPEFCNLRRMVRFNTMSAFKNWLLEPKVKAPIEDHAIRSGSIILTPRSGVAKWLVYQASC